LNPDPSQVNFATCYSSSRYSTITPAEALADALNAPVVGFAGLHFFGDHDDPSNTNPNVTTMPGDRLTHETFVDANHPVTNVPEYP
jgi:hypothetical protein